MRSLEGQVALVMGGGEALGRAIALALAARGVRIVVTGPHERALGETVGEIAHAGGKARHIAGDARDGSVLASAVARAREVFGGLDIVVDASSREGREGEAYAAGPLLEVLGSPGRVVVAGAGIRASLAASIGRVVRELTSGGKEKAITCNGVVLDIPRGEDVPEALDYRATDVAELVVLLCRSEADRLTGQMFTLDDV